MREKKPVSRGLVGVDEGERREQGRGRKGRGKRAKRRRSTHGRRVDREGRERAVPRKTGFEVNYRIVNRGGERRDTRANDVAKERSRQSFAQSFAGQANETKRAGFTKAGKGTKAYAEEVGRGEASNETKATKRTVKGARMDGVTALAEWTERATMLRRDSLRAGFGLEQNLRDQRIAGYVGATQSDTTVWKQMSKANLAREASRTSGHESERDGRKPESVTCNAKSKESGSSEATKASQELVDASEGMKGTRSDGGRRVGWETRRVPNRYDYYLEGHRVNRASKARAKTSVASGVENRRG